MRSVRRPRAPLARLAAYAIAGISLIGCAVPVEVGLDDGEANRVFLALDRAGVDATKEQDPATDGRWRVSVAREDVARALVAMRDEALPRRAGEPTSGKDSLVPSEAAERAHLLAVTAAELRASLESIDGVLDARVHLSAPEPAAGSLHEMGPADRGSASVLFEYRGSTPPVSADSVQRLVAGAVGGLAASDVAVVMLSRTAPAAATGGVLAHVGPIAVARSSARGLQAALAGLVSVTALLAGAVLLLYTRLSRARGALSSASPSEPVASENEPREQPALSRRGA